MVLVPLVLFTRPHVLGATGDYGKQNVPYGPAIAEILASNKDRPSIIVATDQQLAGNLRLHAADIPVTVPGYERFEQPLPVRCDPSGAARLAQRAAASPRPKLHASNSRLARTERDWLAEDLDVRDVAAALQLRARGRRLSFQLCLDLSGFGLMTAFGQVRQFKSDCQ